MTRFHRYRNPVKYRRHYPVAGIQVLWIDFPSTFLRCSLSFRDRDCVVSTPNDVWHPRVTYSLQFNKWWTSIRVSIAGKEKECFFDDTWKLILLVGIMIWTQSRIRNTFCFENSSRRFLSPVYDLSSHKSLPRFAVIGLNSLTLSGPLVY